MQENKLEIYDSIINTLQANDHNGTYDEILQDYENNLENAIMCLSSVLNRLVYEENLEGEELEFYQIQLNRLKEIV